MLSAALGFLAALWASTLVAVAAESPAKTVPGVVIDHSPASSGQFIGSPSLAVLPQGTYVASHDFFGPGSTSDTTVLFSSNDRGQHWSPLARLHGQWWSTLFVHRHALYLIGTSKENGFLIIRKSDDGGRTWSTPKDSQSGLLLADGGYHCAPVPVVVHSGRLWRAMEDTQGGIGWGTHFRCLMLSVPSDADLLDAHSWTFSNRLGRGAHWLGGRFGGWLEGNAVVAPDDHIVDILRVDAPDADEKVALVRISDDGKQATFDPQSGFVSFPGGAKKFTIRRDPQTQQYWALANYVPPVHRGPNPSRIRNTLALVVSPDLVHWEVRTVVLHHPDPERHGFQYVDWLFEGDDLIAVSRTAYDDGVGGAHNQHDANFLTFHRIRNFRSLQPADSVFPIQPR